jgi:polar amino acid transport system substrate-binding protein
MRYSVPWLIASLCLALTCNAASAQTSKTIRLTNGEWQPYLSKDLPHYGFASHIITEAFALVGVEVEYGFFPWKRAYKVAGQEEWTGGAIYWDTEERRRDFYFTDAVVPSTTVLFYLKGTEFDWETYEDLSAVKIGATLVYSYGKTFDAAEAAGTIKTARVPTDETNLKKLLKGRIEVFPGEVMVTYAQIRDTFSKEDAGRFTHHPKPVNDQPLYLLLSKKLPGNEALRDLFNNGLKQLKASGRYDQIIADALAGNYAKPN